MSASMPSQGRPWPEVRAEMLALKGRDLDWRGGRHAAYVWHAWDDVEEVAREAYALFMTENGLGMRVFPSLQEMESAVVQMVAALAEGGPEVSGHMTSGGTESIFLATKAARDWARATHPAITTPEIVAPFSAHPAVNKAAHLLGMRVLRVPTGEDFRADAAALAAAVSPETVMLYGSAPAYSLGVIDDIGALARLAAERGLWLHVDACVGGILAPFVRRLGYPVPAFGFSHPGVTSLSADVHKSGFAAKGASVVLFRDAAHQEFSRYTFTGWPTGSYSTLTFTGTRPGGAIAAAYAVMNYLGEDGYLRIAGAAMRARDRFIAGLAAIPGVHVWGEPDLWAVAYGVRDADITAVTREMVRRGWAVGPVKEPPGIHLMITPVHEPVIDAYLVDLRASIDAVRGGTATAEGRQAAY